MVGGRVIEHGTHDELLELGGRYASGWAAQGDADIIRTRPEIELLLLCISPAKTLLRSARLRELLNQNLDWKYLEDLADSHGLPALLYWKIKSAAPDSVPPSITDKFQQNMRNCLLLTSELSASLTCSIAKASRHSVQRPHPCVSAYNNLALRTFNDLDIFIRTKTSGEPAISCLHEGYASNLQ